MRNPTMPIKTSNPTTGDVSTFLNISGRVVDTGEQGLLGWHLTRITQLLKL